VAQSKCPHCSSTVFQLIDAEPDNARFPLKFIQCAQCGAPVGVLEDVNLGSALQKHHDYVAEMAGRVLAIEKAVQRIEGSLKK
jgi:hypothetical protein